MQRNSFQALRPYRRYRRFIEAHLKYQRGHTLVGEVLLLLVESSVMYCLLWVITLLLNLRYDFKRADTLFSCLFLWDKLLRLSTRTSL